MRALVERLERWWFAPDSRHQPGISRIVLASATAYRLFSDVVPRLHDFATRPAELLDPVSLARWLSLPMQPGSAAIGGLKIALAVTAIGSIVGIVTRWSTIAFALLALYIGLIANAWGYSAHATGLPTLALLVVALSPGIDALSIDAWRSGRKERWLGGATSVWPLRLIALLLMLTYLTAGVSKLRSSGTRWMDGETLAFYMAGGSPRDRVSPARFIADPEAPPGARFRDGIGLTDWAWVAEPTPLGRAIARQPMLTRWLSIFALVLELAFPLALLGRTALWMLLATAAVFHLGIWATMGISFLPYVLVYALFVDWYGLARRLRILRESRG